MSISSFVPEKTMNIQTTESSDFENVAPTSNVEETVMPANENPGRAIPNVGEEFLEYWGPGGIVTISFIIFVLIAVFVGYLIHRREKKQCE